MLNIIVDINDYFKKSYILLRLYNDSNLYKITDNKGINFDDTCYLVENNKQFLYFQIQMKIGIITYNKPHRKTQEVVFGLKEIGYKKIKFIICKFKNLKKKKI